MSIDVEKVTPIHDKNLIKLGIKRNFFSLIKDSDEKPTTNFLLNGEKTEHFPLLIGNIVKGCPSSLYLIENCAGGPIIALRQERK